MLVAGIDSFWCAISFTHSLIHYPSIVCEGRRQLITIYFCSGVLWVSVQFSNSTQLHCDIGLFAVQRDELLNAQNSTTRWAINQQQIQRKRQNTNTQHAVQTRIHSVKSVSARRVFRGIPSENANSPLEICCRPQFLEKQVIVCC